MEGRTMKRLAGFLLAGMVFLTVGASALGAEGEVEIAKVTFSARTYELWQKYLEDKMYIHRRVLGASPGEELRYWIDTRVVSPAAVEVEDSKHVLTFTSGSRRPALARQSLRKMLENLVSRGDFESINANRAAIQPQIDTLYEQKGKIQDKAQKLNQRAGEARRSTRSTSLSQAKQDLYTVSLELAQVEAQLEVIRKRLAEEKPASADHGPIHKVLEGVEENLKRLESVRSEPPIPEKEIQQIRSALDRIRSFSSGLQQRSREAAKPILAKLKGMLIDAETRYAGLAAKQRVMEKHLAQLREPWEKADEINAQAKIIESQATPIEEKIQELLRQMETFRPEHFPIEKPVIVWAAIPEERE
jgi:hypothetical protein